MFFVCFVWLLRRVQIWSELTIFYSATEFRFSSSLWSFECSSGVHGKFYGGFLAHDAASGTRGWLRHGQLTHIGYCCIAFMVFHTLCWSSMLKQIEAFICHFGSGTVLCREPKFLQIFCNLVNFTSYFKQNVSPDQTLDSFPQKCLKYIYICFFLFTFLYIWLDMLIACGSWAKTWIWLMSFMLIFAWPTSMTVSCYE